MTSGRKKNTIRGHTNGTRFQSGEESFVNDLNNRSHIASGKVSGLKTALILGGVIVFGWLLSVLAIDVKVGQVIILIYGIAALLLSIDSKYCFIAALFALLMVPVLRVTGDFLLMENYAIYSFLLLVVGTILAALEARRIKTNNNNSKN